MKENCFETENLLFLVLQNEVKDLRERGYC
jgi:hypothetical protein